MLQRPANKEVVLALYVQSVTDFEGRYSTGPRADFHTEINNNGMR